MFVTIMKTARTSDLRRGHRTAGFVSELRVGSFLRNDLADCTIVTIERPSADRLSACPYIYVRSTRTRARALQSLHGLLYQEPPRLWSRLKFWRTTDQTFTSPRPRTDMAVTTAAFALGIFGTLRSFRQTGGGCASRSQRRT